MPALDSALRKQLERAVIRARDIAEAGAEATLVTLAVREREAFATLSQSQRDLRTALRARAKNLGEGAREAGYAPLIEAIAYEQWHRLLFARFLAENGLLMHPVYAAPLSIEECGELAAGEGADNGWDLAGRYAAAMLPGIFRPGDPAATVRLAREHRAALEKLVAELPAEVFTSDDGLGWTYQFWQAKKKGEVNASGVKIGARELAPVTQLFTEDYMVRFLLENSLGAWWAARHPESPLLAEMAYLRFTEDGAPAAGTFPGWPETAAEVTMMDPCCGSGHFLTRAFDLLREMRMEEEGLDAAAAGDAVLRDNLFGLELDERCVQIAAFAVALEAWKSGGYRALPTLQIACSGVPVAGQLEDWLALAGDDVNLRETLWELYRVFQDAPSLGSLINPKQVAESGGLFSSEWAVTSAVLEESGETDKQLSSIAALKITIAAVLLSQKYTLVVTNVPYLSRSKQSNAVRIFADTYHASSKGDVATMMLERCMRFTADGGTSAAVLPTNWMYFESYKALRATILQHDQLALIALLGPAAFEDMNWWAIRTGLVVLTNEHPLANFQFAGFDLGDHRVFAEKELLVKLTPVVLTNQAQLQRNPDSRITIGEVQYLPLLAQYADCLQGIATADYPRFGRFFWERSSLAGGWALQQSTVEATRPYGGREHMLWWEDGESLRNHKGAYVRGTPAWGKAGVSVSQMQRLPVTLYTGEVWDNNSAVILPKEPAHLPAIWAFCSSPDFHTEVRKVNSAVKVDNGYFVKVPFDLEHWQRVAAEQYPDGLPEPHSDDPTQWLFTGHPKDSDNPLQVAVARLLGYRWPEQPDADGLEAFADSDGIVPLPSVRGESPAGERLRALLAAAYGAEWSPAVQERLLAEVGFAGRDLGAWLADGKGFFAQHAKLFHNRPFIWQIWDGARDGFAVLVNAHKLDRATLEKLIYTYLGDWIARQELARQSGDASAEGRLVKARELKAKLEAILLGEAPYDVYVRWKPLHEQPIGWEPDLNDGVRLNIRPFVQAGVLRAKFSVNWNKDRGDNPPGSTARTYAAEAQAAATPDGRRGLPEVVDGRERFNAVHLSRAVKDAARAAHAGEGEWA